jgi:hypothetical protein
MTTKEIFDSGVEECSAGATSRWCQGVTSSVVYITGYHDTVFTGSRQGDSFKFICWTFAL